MGLFDFFQDVAKVISPITRVAAPILGIVNPALGVATATIGGSFDPFLPAPAPPSVPVTGAVSGVSFDPIQQFTGVPALIPPRGFDGQFDPSMVTPAALPAAVPVIMGLTRTLALTISKLAGRLGITVLGVAGLSRVGVRIWRSLTTFARRHPGISVLSMLTSLGLTLEEASEYIAWGTMKRRRRRGGISTADMRIARRTIRRISSFQQDLGGLRRPARRGLRVPPGTSIVRAG